MTGPRLLGPGATAEEQSNYINALDKCNRGLPQEAPYRWDEKRFVYAQTLAGVIVRRLDSFPVEEIKYKPPSEYCGQCRTETPHTYSHARAGGICTVCGRLVKDIKLLVEIHQLIRTDDFGVASATADAVGAGAVCEGSPQGEYHHEKVEAVYASQPTGINGTQPGRFGAPGGLMHIHFLHTDELVIAWRQDPEKNALRIAGRGGRIIDAAALREDPTSRIITDDPQAVCRLLGMPFPDVQVIKQ